jgi:hypothetical protein
VLKFHVHKLTSLDEGSTSGKEMCTDNEEQWVEAVAVAASLRLGSFAEPRRGRRKTKASGMVHSLAAVRRSKRTTTLRKNSMKWSSGYR